MIALLEGSIGVLRFDSVVIVTGGVGYKVHCTAYALGKLAALGGNARVFVHTSVREDAITLFGFLEEEELAMFELLITVSGVGPKMGLNILNIASPEMIRAAVSAKDASVLTRVSGVGKKTAERIVLELGNKVAALSEGHASQVSRESESLEALVALGYSVSESRDALAAVSGEITRIEDRVSAALKLLGTKRK